ncbi:MAG: hypothetical protein KC736_01240 [Candidatus Moranbacteria bacterium]|nr:hypothetical protein [Candidatus Moranbacteria bacterium]
MFSFFDKKSFIRIAHLLLHDLLIIFLFANFSVLIAEIFLPEVVTRYVPFWFLSLCLFAVFFSFVFLSSRSEKPKNSLLALHSVFVKSSMLLFLFCVLFVSSYQFSFFFASLLSLGVTVLLLLFFDDYFGATFCQKNEKP